MNLSKFDRQNFGGNLKRSHRSETKFLLNDMLILAKPLLVYFARFLVYLFDNGFQVKKNIKIGLGENVSSRFHLDKRLRYKTFFNKKPEVLPFEKTGKKQNNLFRGF